MLFNQDAVSLKVVRCVSGRKINFLKILLRNLSQSKSNRYYLGFFEYSKKKFFWAKIDSALKRRFLMTAIIKNGTNCQAHFQKNYTLRVLFRFAYVDQPFMRTKHIKFVFLMDFFAEIFFLTPTLALPPWPEIYIFFSRLSTKFPRCIVGKHYGKNWIKWKGHLYRSVPEKASNQPALSGCDCINFTNDMFWNH